MQPSFWHERWQAGQLGFHLVDTNPHLLARWQATPETARRVLVPLCGKTVDMAWLAGRGHDVVGVELSELAARAFFAERGIEANVVEQGGFRIFSHENVMIFVGDFFAATQAGLGGPFDACWDRAALIALPPEMRDDYVRTVRGLLRPGAEILLVTLAFDAGGGPPFSVEADEVRARHAGADVDALDVVDVTAASPNLLARGATSARELVFRIGVSG